MAVDYQVRELDDVLSGTEHAPTVHVDVRRGLDASYDESLFRGVGAATRAAREGFAEVVRWAQGRAIGTVEFRDVVVLGRGLIVEPATKTVWSGESLGWSDPSIALDVRWFTEDWRPGGALPVEPEKLDAAMTLDGAVLLLAPGFGVYGHWLIDFAPRLIAWREQFSDLPVLTGQLDRWQFRMARRLRAPLRGAPAVLPRRPVRVGRLVVPIMHKRRQAIDRPGTVAAWDELRDVLLAEAPRSPVPTADRIYVSRSTWRAGRSLLNDDEVEERARSHGYHVVHPQELSLRQQAWLFAGARHVLGVDGSGLHNTVYAGPDVHATVIDTHRTNLFHAGVLNVRRQHLSHLASTEEPGVGWHLPLEILDRHLETVRTTP